MTGGLYQGRELLVLAGENLDDPISKPLLGVARGVGVHSTKEPRPHRAPEEAQWHQGSLTLCRRFGEANIGNLPALPLRSQVIKTFEFQDEHSGITS